MKPSSSWRAHRRRAARLILPLTMTLAPAITPSTATAQSAVCFRGRPLPRCSAFTVFAITGVKRVAGTTHLETFGAASSISQPHVPDLADYLSWTLGVMVNRDSAHAIGAVAEFGFDSTGSRVALEARRRTWLPRGGSIDFTAGGLVAQGHKGARFPTAYGMTTGVALGAFDLFAITIGGDVAWPASGNHLRAAIHGGLRVSSYAALASLGLVIAGAALVVPRD